MARLGFKALDGQDVFFDIPRGCNRFLVERAIKHAHHGDDAAISDMGLSRKEVEFIAEVVAELEAHRPQESA